MRCYAFVLAAWSCALVSMASPAGSPVVLSEFMASNVSVLADEDGDYPDWIEVHNVAATNVNLGGWSLTDDASALGKWRFPSTNLAAGGYLVVFASGKDRHRAGAPLHTNFKLNASGEYLALVLPDLTTVATAYAPVYPPQASDVSYGLDPGLRINNLIGSSSRGRVWVPQDGVLGTNWILPGFDDSSWSNASASVGFVVGAIGALPVAGLTNALVGYWKFDEVAGLSARDSSGVAGTGLLFNFPTNGSQWVAGRQQGALQFRGSPNTDFVRVANYPKATNGLSVSAWVWADGRPVWASIAKNWGATLAGQFHFGLRDTAGDLDLFLHTSGGDFNVREGTLFPLGSWQHVAFTAGNGVMRLFRNGQLVASGTYSGNFVTPPLASLGLGVKLGDAGSTADPGAPGYWQGRLDDLAIWNRTLADSEVQVIAQAGASFGPLVGTDVGSRMLGSNATCYLRLPFVLADPQKLARWVLKMRYDDGFAAWLNGVEIVRRNTPDALDWNSAATVARTADEILEPEVFNLAGLTDFLLPGTNLLAIQGLNVTKDNFDFLVQAEMETSTVTDTTNALAYFTVPTPGAENVVGVSVLGPIIKDVAHQPSVPTDAEDLLVTARVGAAFAPLATVVLRYRVMFSNEVEVAMLDDGQHGDQQAGDGIYGASIPAAAAGPGQMIRYYITATDSLGRASRAPLFVDPLGSPQYRGTVVRNPGVTSNVPILQWFVASPAAAETDLGTRCSLFTYNQEFHDNVFVRIRGGTARGWPKKSFKIELNEGDHFLIHPGLRRVSEFDLNATYTDKAYVRAVVTSEQQLAAGVPAPETFHLQLRQNGVFYSLALFVEQPDRDFLRRHALDENGSLYKCGPGSTFDSVAPFEKKTRQTEDKSDAQALLNGLVLTGPALETYVFDNLDLPSVINFLACIVICQNIDASDKNLFLYRDTEGSREWRLLPWDLDLTFGPDALNTDAIVFSSQNTNTPACASHPFIGARPFLLQGGKYNRLIEAIVNTPRARQMLLRRVRTLTEEFLGTSVLQDRMEALFTLLGPEVQLDTARWGGNAHFPGVTYTFRQAIDRIKNEYLAPRLPYLTGTNIAAVGRLNPVRQPFNVLLRIVALEVNPSSRNQLEEYVCLTNPAPLAVDLSGWRLAGAVQFTFKPGTVVPSNEVIYLSPNVAAFRARAAGPHAGQRLFVQGNYQGQLSARGESLSLFDPYGRVVDTLVYPGNPSLAQQFLRVTELMYHPAAAAGDAFDPEQFEYIELRNISTNVALDLTGVRFTAGVEFDFTGSGVGTLAPGARVLVVRNPTAFAARYGSGLPVAGQYVGSLDNAGERLRLLDAQNEEVLDFHYDNAWYPPTDGLGFSLVILDQSAAPDEWNHAANWRASGRLQGSPGVADPLPAAAPAVVINEALTHSEIVPPTDSIELYNPGSSPSDVSGWFLSDDFRTPKKFRIPAGVRIDPGAYRLFTETDFNPVPGVPPSFSLGADGDEVWLFSADAAGNLGGYVHGFRFGAAEDGVSFGRWVTSDGLEYFAPQVSRTPGGANSGPRVGPVLISEIMYHPGASGTNDDALAEFIELQNSGATPVALFEPGAPTNTWAVTGGIDFLFPTNITLAAGEFVLLVGFDPATDAAALAAFQARYGVGGVARIFGPFRGKLANEGEDLALRKPITINGRTLAFAAVDEVHYDDHNPWPEGADGFGLSLQRRDHAYGNDPASWIAALPTAGRALTPASGQAPPRIEIQPAGVTASAFGPASFSVTASGAAPLRYQWRFQGANLPAATNAVLQIPATQPAQNGDYQVVVFNGAGSVVSSNATLTLLFPMTVLASPQSVALRGSTNAVDYGSTTNRNGSFSIAAYSPSSLAYQWRFNGVSIPGAATPTLTVTNVNLANDGWYDVVVTDAVGSVISTPARLTVLLTPQFVVTPTDQSVVQGGGFTASVVIKGNPPPFGFSWRQVSTTVATSVSDDFSNFFTRTNIQPGQAGLYRIVITNAAAPLGTINAPFNVTVLPDTDGNGLPDAWEQAFFGNATGLDPNADPDGDGMLNWQEYLAGTDPTDAGSCLKLEATLLSGSSRLTVGAISNRTYTVQYTDALDIARWRRLLDLPARATNGPVTFDDPNPGSAGRWYRVVTPAAP